MTDTRFGALKEVRRHQPAAVSVELPEPPALKAVSPIRATGKSSNQDFERLSIYVRKDTKKAATRKWEDATGRDMSDLVEHLLTQYLNA